MKLIGLMLRAALGLTVLSSAGAFGMEKEASDPLIQAVIALLRDSDKEIRALGLEQVRSGAPGVGATRAFARQLPELTPDAQVALLGALGDRGDRRARADLLAVLKNTQEESVRVAAIRALGALGRVDDLPLLIDALAAPSAQCRAAARASLVRLSGAEVPAEIARRSATAAPPVRVVLIGVLAERRALDTIPVLLPAAVDADPRVRAAAMTALGQLADLQHLDGMVQGVLRAEPGPEREAAEKQVMRVCARSADARCRPLLRVWQKRSAAEREALLPTLGRVGGDAALRVIDAYIAADEPEQHRAGIRALCNWPDASVAPRLIELARADQHPSHRIAALRALIRVAPLRDRRPPAARLALLQTAMTMASRDEERRLVLKRASAIRDVATLRFVVPFLDQPAYAQQACETIVELAHHRGLREPHKAEFHQALDAVIRTSRDAVVVDRARRYQKGQTWVRPKK